MADPISTVANSTGPSLREKETLDDMANSPIAQFFQRRAAEAPQFVEGLKTLYNDPSKVKELDTVKDAINNFSLPGDVYAGRLDPMSDESIKRSFGLTQSLAGQAPFNAVEGAGIFGGRLSKTAPHADMDLVESILANPRSKIPEDALWEGFGSMKGAEGKMRYEIDDSMSHLHPTPIDRTVGGILHHPELYAAYPELRDLPIKLLDKEYGGYSAKDHIGLAGGMDEATAHSVLLHELQHAIQRKEGFVGGDNPSRLRDIAFDKYINDEVNPEIGSKVFGSLFGAKDSLSKSQVNQLFHNLYMRNAGEVEARIVQGRMHDTPHQRREHFPLGDADIPPEKIIVPYKDINN